MKLRRWRRLLTADAKTEERETAKLFEFCRTKITNTSNDASGITPDDRKKLKEEQGPGDTLRTWNEALATLIAVCFIGNSTPDSMRVLCSRPIEGDILFDQEIRSFPNPYFLDPCKHSGQCRRYLEVFQSRLQLHSDWHVEMAGRRRNRALIDGSKRTGPSLQHQCRHLRSRRSSVSGNLSLREDSGTLEGRRRFNTQASSQLRRRKRSAPVRDRARGIVESRHQRNWRVLLKSVTSRSKMSLTTSSLSFCLSRRGSRRMLRRRASDSSYNRRFPSVELVQCPLSSSRKYPIYFHYPWSRTTRLRSGGCRLDLLQTMPSRRLPFGSRTDH